ncbi:TPA: HNH endonuclease [Enterobacter kobei]|nr:HNH endonuclease [Enterobacter kobei]
MKAKKLPELSVINELIHYGSDTGIFTWKKDRGAIAKKGDPLRQVDSKGYTRVKIAGKKYLLHRIAFYLYYGEEPEFIDHINSIRSDNRIENLRACTLSQNGFNVGLTSRSTTGVKGVAWNKASQKYQCTIKVKGKSFYFGLYDDIELAELVAMEARLKFHGSFARHS